MTALGPAILASTLYVQAGASVCDLPRELLRPSEGDLFTPEQSIYLGEAFAEHAEGSFRVVEDDALVEPLRKLGRHLERQIPDLGLELRFFLVDLPIVHAFAVPGGRISVTRKLVGFAQSQEELAGVLAHEIGHLASRHLTAAYSTVFRDVLGVTQLGDREDVFRRYRDLVAARSGLAFEGAKEEHRKQVEADRIAVHACERAFRRRLSRRSGTGSRRRKERRETGSPTSSVRRASSRSGSAKWSPSAAG